MTVNFFSFLLIKCEDNFKATHFVDFINSVASLIEMNSDKNRKKMLPVAS